ncbi:MAG: hypothetical protein ACLQAT_09690 [Candidatus Binataceae bacterium]
MNPAKREDRDQVAFARLLEALAVNDASKHKLRVLVWGPALPAVGQLPDPIQEKRIQIKEALKAEGHYAYFSEDLVPSASPLPVNFLEAVQAREMDAVVALATTHGAVGEVHEEGIQLGKKLSLWLSPAARGKYLDMGMRHNIEASGGRVVYFQNSHVSACALTLASVDFVNWKRYLQAQIETQIEALQEAAPIKRGK